MGGYDESLVKQQLIRSKGEMKLDARALHDHEVTKLETAIHARSG